MEKDIEFDPLTNELSPEDDSEGSGIDYNALQQAFDTSWGRSSTPRTAQFSVKFQLQGTNHIVASYTAIVNFVSEKDMIEQKRRYAAESADVLKAHAKFIKDRYKAITGKTLKLNEKLSSDSVEVIGMNFFNPRKTCYYRKKNVYEM